ncbi:hypothetical protein ELI30_09455 [Rhizobium leguminosarum]|uniref:hypothetical protein n=1 Tax=Rhizobium leguminosarum TaxID=384 RepID=UPI001030F3F4|nr:hypothetical protein [Rhizobium leguminosarum]TAV48510.1 hypothetical protein ELI32_09910 [Rhizobium leguminosarum]TAV58010.1 hypothetical protein ELI31_09440 [Rhizobium leguminosarum]TAV68951.1 hypothetical protein ELI30_09455 [Rhizobium leguminosarum]
MASFVEEATLSIDDKASGKVRSLNKDISNLIRNAKRLNGLKFDVGGIKQAQSQVRSLGKSINALPKSKTVTLTTRNVTQNVTRGPTTGRGAGVPPVIPGRTGTGAAARSRRGYAAGIGASMGIGGGVRVFASAATGIGAMTSAAFLAAGALKKVAESAASRDRTSLLLEAGATPEQRAIIRGAGVPQGQGPIRLTQDERQKLTQSLLGDVQGTPQQKAISSVNIEAQLEKTVLPRLFAQNPDKSREEVLGGLRTLVQGMNLASSEIVDSAGTLTKDGLRVLDAQMIAMSADPELTPQQIKTVLANLKTSAFQLDTEALARVFINAGSRGQRVGNETFRMQQAFQGQLDIKALNKALSVNGLLLDAARNAKGNVIAGTGHPVDEQLLAESPATWVAKYIVAPMEKELAKITPEIAPTNAERVSYLNNALPGASSAAKQGLVDTVLGDAQMQASLDQARAVQSQDITKALADSWVAQTNNVATAFTDATASFGNSVAQFANAAGIFSSVADAIRGNPTATTAGAIGGAALGTGLLARGALNMFSGIGGTGGAAGTAASATAGVLGTGGLLAGIAALLKSSSADNKYTSMSTDERAKARAEARAIYENYKPRPQAETYAMLAGHRAASGGNNPLTNAVDMATTLGDTSNRFQNVFDTGSRQLADSGTTIETGITTAGMNVGATIGSAITSAGATVASQIASAISNVVINVPRQQAVAAPNVGAVTPTE